MLAGAWGDVRSLEELPGSRVARGSYHHNLDRRADVIHQGQRVSGGEQSEVRGLGCEEVERPFGLVAEVGPLGQARQAVQN